MNKIREKRIELGWSMAKAAKTFEVPYRTWQSWEIHNSVLPYIEILVVDKLDQYIKRKEMIDRCLNEK